MRKAKKAAPKKTLTSAEIHERRSEAFYQMEEPLRDCSDRAEIAGELFPLSTTATLRRRFLIRTRFGR